METASIAICIAHGHLVFSPCITNDAPGARDPPDRHRLKPFLVASSPAPSWRSAWCEKSQKVWRGVVPARRGLKALGD